MKVLLASPHGFCAGVLMAVQSLERAIELFGTPLYVYHEIVHNRHIVDDFTAKGVVFVDEVSEVPPGSTLLYSAHGVSPAIRRAAEERDIRAIDCTCPLVAKVHNEVKRFASDGYTIVLIGHEGHDEVIGVLGEAPDRIALVETPEDIARLQVSDPSRVAYLTQTTLSVDDANFLIEILKHRFPAIEGPPKDDICYATQNRQDAVRQLAAEADVVLVIGSGNSSNSRRLAEVAKAQGAESYLIENVHDIQDAWLENADTVVLTAGASAPEHLVDDCLRWFEERHSAAIEHRVLQRESAVFPMPRLLRQPASQSAG